MNRAEIERRTGLDGAALDRLEQIEAVLPLMADLAGADLFVDCMDRADGRMFVAVQAEPSFMPSAYRTSVVGCYAEQKDEPAVYRAMETRAPVRDIKAVTQEESTVRQDVVPVMDGAGQPIGVLISERDISRDLRRERKYQALVHRSESPTVVSAETAARREAHHRVKNHLQMVASLLNIQARKSDNPEVRQAFCESTARVLSIAAVNDLLTQHESEPVSLRSFLDKLRQNLSMLYGAAAEVRLVLEGDDLTVDPDRATDIALVVNELISNACQHAFHDRAGGEVRVILKRGERYSAVTVQDDGTGFDLCREGGGFGMSIVKMLVRDKLGGKLYLSSGREGTSVTFDFKVWP